MSKLIRKDWYGRKYIFGLKIPFVSASKYMAAMTEIDDLKNQIAKGWALK